MNVKKFFIHLVEDFNSFRQARRYPMRIADIYQKRNLFIVVIQSFSTNTFNKYEISSLLDDEELLIQISPKELRILIEFWLQKISLEKGQIIVHEDGVFLSRTDEETFYSFEDLDNLIEDEKLINTLDPKSAFLLGKISAEKGKKLEIKRKLFLVK